MSEAEVVRRSSYGPTSPRIGRRGATTRKRIAEVSLELFGRVGYVDTSVDALARAAGVSRATLYQYFGGKDDIFLELLEECREALYRVSRRIGPLGADATGFDNLHWWLGEWSWVFEKYSTMFIQWSAVASMDQTARDQITRSIRGYNHRIAARLEASEMAGLDAEAAAMMITGLVHDVNLFVHTDRAYGRGTQDVVDTLSVFLQSMLYPETPPEVFSGLDRPERSEPRGGIAFAHPALPDLAGLSVEDRIANLSRRSAQTVQGLVRAGTARFNAIGYRRTSVEDIVEMAQVARGTFYKYFTDKLDMLVAISVDMHSQLAALAIAADALDPVTDRDGLSAWLTRSYDFYERHFGSIEAWNGGVTDSALIAAIGRASDAQFDSAAAAMLARAPQHYPFDPVVSALILRASSTSVLNKAKEILHPISGEELVRLSASCVRRGFFGEAG
ncbi:TetR/AcrR family transcriptional regulator [Mycobacterium paraseoulense]|uniref:TetR family transcriptional regulator n=1 Tax=Mycobacterium paraseoulense TaxID=590652 RepID=A0A1X0IGU6_9MYCO|nr:TetR/AcrR family transcriptional regulator [Mycobacterium paraseoulense]MCV7393878.1 TetR/AcrR family transcriptional regulator [Mycobacterium paraseoulense]ORB45579.1 TetR family transcriptional regulator [Mycobacterium paraseoulense]